MTFSYFRNYFSYLPPWFHINHLYHHVWELVDFCGHFSVFWKYYRTTLSFIFSFRVCFAFYRNARQYLQINYFSILSFWKAKTAGQKKKPSESTKPEHKDKTAKLLLLLNQVYTAVDKAANWGRHLNANSRLSNKCKPLSTLNMTKSYM